MKVIEINTTETVKILNDFGHMYYENNGGFSMPYRRKEGVVRVEKSRHQSPKKTNPNSGIYSWDLCWFEPDGQRKQKTIQGSKKEADTEALRIALEIQKILNIGLEEYETLQRKAKCINDIPSIFIKAKMDEGWSDRTNNIFDYAWEYFIKSNTSEQVFKMAHVSESIERLIPRHLRNYMAHLRTNRFGRSGKQKLSPHTQSKYFRSIKTCLKWLHENDYVEKDPTRGLKGPKVPNIIVNALSLDDVKYALEKTKDHPRGDEIYALLVAYLYFGCRATELLPPYLTWDNYYGDSIKRANLKQNKADVEWLIVPLDGADGKVLKRILDQRLEDQEKWPQPFPYTYWQVRGLLTYRYFKSIGIKANFQILRDTAATLRQVAGQPLSAVSALLGHSSTTVTTKYYTDKDMIRGTVAGSLDITEVG